MSEMIPSNSPYTEGVNPAKRKGLLQTTAAMMVWVALSLAFLVPRSDRAAFAPLSYSGCTLIILWGIIQAKRSERDGHQ